MRRQRGILDFDQASVGAMAQARVQIESAGRQIFSPAPRRVHDKKIKATLRALIFLALKVSMCIGNYSPDEYANHIRRPSTHP